MNPTGLVFPFTPQDIFESISHKNHPLPILLILCTMYTSLELRRQELSMSQSETVTIRLSAEIKGKLEALAASTKRSKSWLAAQAIATYVEEQSWQIQQIEAAITLADSNQATWVENTDMNTWLDSWGTEHEQPMP
jgi:RHH-type transcriptional regulator, rel operon repressor / antitoxin RelB